MPLLKISYIDDSNEYLFTLSDYQKKWAKHYKERKLNTDELTMPFTFEKAIQLFGEPVAIDDRGTFYWRGVYK